MQTFVYLVFAGICLWTLLALIRATKKRASKSGSGSADYVGGGCDSGSDSGCDSSGGDGGCGGGGGD